MLVIIPVMIAIVVAFRGGSDHASRRERRDAQKRTADEETNCVFHGVPLGEIPNAWIYSQALAGMLLQG
jgi:hypothetical protein